MGKFKFDKRKLLSIIIYIIIGAAPEIVIGALLTGRTKTASALLIGGFSFAVIVAAVNLGVFSAMKDKLKKRRVNDIYEDALQKRQRPEDFKKIHDRLALLLLSCYVYVFSIFAALGCIVVGFVILYAKSGASMTGVFLFIWLQYFIFNNMLPKPHNEGYGNLKLSEKEFPLIFRAVSEAAAMAGVTKEFSLYVYDANNITIVGVRKKVEIYIGKDIIRYSSENELKAAMVHEFAHALHGDLLLGMHLNAFRAFTEFNYTSVIVIGSIIYALSNYVEFFKNISSKRTEEYADSVVKEKGLQQDFINGVAKSTVMGYYFSIFNFFNIFEDEKKPDKYSEKLFNNFLTIYAEKSAEWISMCKKELPPRLGTHPTCGERMENAGVSEIYIDFENADEAFRGEALKVYGEIDKGYGITDEAWKEARDINYLKPLEVIEEYEKSGDGDLYAVTNAYIQLCRYEECIGVQNKILEKNPCDSFAHLIKGMILLHNRDDSGIEEIKTAMDLNLRHVERGSEVMFSYILRRGLSDKRKELDEWQKNILEKYFALIKVFSFKDIKKFMPHGLDRGQTEKIAEILKGFNINDCYITKVRFPDFKEIEIVFIKTAEIPDTDEHYNLLRSVSGKLDEVLDNYYLLDVAGDKKISKKLKKMPEAAIFTFEPLAENGKKAGSENPRLKKTGGLFAFYGLFISMLIWMPLGVTAFAISETAPHGTLIALGATAGIFVLIFFGITGAMITNSAREGAAKKKGKTVRLQIELKEFPAEEARMKLDKYVFSLGYGKTDYDGKEGYVRQCKELSYAFILFNKTENGAVLEAFILLYGQYGAATERGVYGIDIAPDRYRLRKALAAVLDILDAPKDITV